MSSTPRWKRSRLLYLITLVLTLGVVGYAHWIEPIWIQVTHHELKAKVTSPLKIAHLSDLHIHQLGYREKHLLQLLHQESPDVILISGDSIADNGDYTAVGNLLKELHAPLGVWLVRGNWEHWRPSQDELKIYTAAGVHFLDNKNFRLRHDVWIIGLDDNLAGTPDPRVALTGVPQDAFKIGLFHSPDYFVEHANAFDLVLAGHTHGGQVRIPFLPPLWLPPGSGPYVEGWYKAPSTASKMYVSRGVGNSLLELRFFCRPELPIITIAPRNTRGRNSPPIMALVEMINKLIYVIIT